jgi:hypothetical protein
MKLHSLLSEDLIIPDLKAVIEIVRDEEDKPHG